MYEMRLFGESCITKTNKKVSIKSKRLIALLALAQAQDKAVDRQELYKYLWSSEEDAKTTKVYAKRFRSLLSSNKKYCDQFLTIDKTMLSFKDLLLTDTGQFEQLIQQGTIQSYKEAIDLYDGGFMQGFTMRLLPIEFEDWLELQRSYWQQQATDTLDKIIKNYLDGRRITDPKEAMCYIQKSLNINPWRDEVQLQLAQLYIQQRQPAQAKRQLENYSIRLKKHLDVEVGPEVNTLLRKLSRSEDIEDISHFQNSLNWAS